MLLHLVVALNYPEVPITILIIAQVLSSYHESRNTIPTLNLERISSMMCNMGQDDVIVVTLHIRQHILKHFYIYIEDNLLKSDESECIVLLTLGGSVALSLSNPVSVEYGSWWTIWSSSGRSCVRCGFTILSTLSTICWRKFNCATRTRTQRTIFHLRTYSKTVPCGHN